MGSPDATGATTVGDVEIVPFERHPELGPVLAAWHVEAFGHLYDPTVWNLDVAEREFEAMARPDGDARTWVAFGSAGRAVDDVLGSVSLLATDDLPGFEHAAPWLASLYVVPAARGLGVGDRLVRHVTTAAAHLGHREVWLFTAGQEEYYLRRGWRPVATTRSNGHDATVMVRSTAAHAARRAVCSTWSSDPDVGGAYSYLRVGATPADRDVLAGPVLDGLRLAGEATWRDHPATMHGAWFSGERAARDLADAASVLVVGAGLAGIAAARAVQARGGTVVVLERTDRLGGRAATDTSLGLPVPLGGAWLHGTDGHPLVDLVTTFDDPWPDDTTYLVGHGAVADDDLEAARSARVRVYAALGAVTDDEPAAAVVDRVLAAETALTPAATATVRRWLTNEFESLYAAPMGDISARFGLEDYELPGGDHAIVSGLEAAIASLADGLDVRFGHRVGELARVDGRWRTDTGVEADAAIVTVPLPALRTGRLRIEPALPPAVRAAMDRIGAGPVAKLFVTYDEAWWPPVRAVRIAGDTPLVVAVDVTRSTGVPTLCWFSVGEAALRVEAMTEDERCRLADEVARSCRLVA